MKKLVVLILTILLAIIFIGCSNNQTVVTEDKVEISLDRPPVLKILFGNKSIDAILGTYSWDNVQSDSPSPKELVKRGTTIAESSKSTLTLDFESKPSKLSVNMYKDNKEIVQEVSDYKIILPETKGKLIYEVIATWEQGTAYYAFEVYIE